MQSDTKKDFTADNSQKLMKVALETFARIFTYQAHLRQLSSLTDIRNQLSRVSIGDTLLGIRHMFLNDGTQKLIRDRCHFKTASVRF